MAEDVDKDRRETNRRPPYLLVDGLIALLSEKATDQKRSFHSDQDGWLCPCR